MKEGQYQRDRESIIFAGRQRTFALELAAEQKRAEALGLSDQALAAKLEMQTQKDTMELEALRMQLQNKAMTEDQFRIAKEQKEKKSQESMNTIKKAHLEAEMVRAKSSGSFMDRLRIQTEMNSIEGAGRVSKAKAFFQSQEMNMAKQGLDNLATLMQTNNKKMFMIGKAAALASAAVNTAQGFTKALAQGGIMGPVLGATVLAAGAVQIANISAQKFSGGTSLSSGGGEAPKAETPSQSASGQAHNGMDAIPMSMHNKSFIMAGGERVIQPEANKDLTGFLKGQGEGGGNTYNININATADSNIEGIKVAVMDAIREASERGQTVISHRGVA